MNEIRYMFTEAWFDAVAAEAQAGCTITPGVDQTQSHSFHFEVSNSVGAVTKHSIPIHIFLYSNLSHSIYRMGYGWEFLDMFKGNFPAEGVALFVLKVKQASTGVFGE